MAVYPHQLNVIQCPRKFAYTYNFDGRPPTPDSEWAGFGREVHIWIEVFAKIGVASNPGSKVAACAMQAVPLLVPGAAHEQTYRAAYKDWQLAAKVDMAMPGRGWDWKTGKDRPVLLQDRQFRVTAWVLGENLGWPVELNWVYLDKTGKKPPVVETHTLEREETLAWLGSLDTDIAEIQVMWELQGKVQPLEVPKNGPHCENRGHHCDYIGLCRMGRTTVATAKELMEEYNRRKAGNAAVNPPELPAAEEVLLAEAVLQPANNLARDAQATADAAARVPKRTRRTKAEMEAARAATAELAASVTNAIGTSLEAAAKALEPEPRTISGWTLGDLQKLAAELEFQGIYISFGFKS